MRTESLRRWAIGHLVLARLRETWREPEVLFWSFAFPVVLAVVLGLAFRDREAQVQPVAIVSPTEGSSLVEAAKSNRLLRVEWLDEAEAMQRLALGRVDVVGVLRTDGVVEYHLDPARPEGELARARLDAVLQAAAGRRDVLETVQSASREPGGRYVDFLVPGLVGMNLMSGGLWGVGFALVDMRIKKLLKLLFATPLSRFEFLAAQMLVRTGWALLEATALLGFAHFVLEVPVRCSPVSLAILVGVGALTFGGMGVLVACRASRIETASGLVNLVTLPMFVASGIFFSSDRFPPAVLPLVQVLPLTALNDALRALILEGASLQGQGARLAVLVLWAAVSFAVGLRLFRWK